ncbi:zinc-dependent peptidase [Gemmata sp. G18]|uniref:Zinc-dependent peptidase n=1 Tax=Gemmata palustris TaxID=2822762 RepID=A0ABS5BSY6_9BACT|nr:zinc-dependent peptidase [Gemmata palustris]MBP3956844.1 zinc-dependent peptidase [Gemmata palustris]
MLFSWLRTRRRRKLLAEPFPLRWTGFLERNVGHYTRLSPSDQAQLRDATRVLIAEKLWLGRGGLFITEEMRVTIAAQAALLLLGPDRGYYPWVREVVVFPTEFRTPVAGDDWEDDLLSDQPLAGQAVDRGPVLLAWDEVLAEGRTPDAGYNVVVHEFAHQLDFRHGVTAGAPDLGDRALETRWRYVMTVALEDHRRALRENNSGTLFTPHAADNEMEFFADATEAFYCRSAALKRLHPEMYSLLAAYYGIDPITRFGTGKREDKFKINP